jgi:hypothetical protein
MMMREFGLSVAMDKLSFVFALATFIATAALTSSCIRCFYVEAKRESKSIKKKESKESIIRQSMKWAIGIKS